MLFKPNASVEDAEYEGVRIRVRAELAAQIPLQIDVGFGDAITPEPSLTAVYARHGPSPSLRVSDRIRRKKVSCRADDPIAAQRRATECGRRCQFWSGDRTIRAGRNAGTVFNKRSVPVVHQESDQAALGRYAHECRKADGGRRLAEESDSGPEDQEPCPKSYAHDFSV
jgi:hypothetical protein